MTSQADFFVIESFISPLQVLFGGLEPQQEAVYCKHLRKFDREVLQAGVDHLQVNHRFKRFPALAECMEACTKASMELKGGSVSGAQQAYSGKFPWEERKEQISKMLHQPVETFCNDPEMFQRAHAEGWHLDLECHVLAVAEVQAQMIVPGGKGIAWQGMKIFGSVPTDDQQRDFFQRCRAQANTGMILVTVPLEQQERMRRDAISRQQSADQYGNLGQLLEPMA